LYAGNADLAMSVHRKTEANKRICLNMNITELVRINALYQQNVSLEFEKSIVNLRLPNTFRQH